MSKLYAVSYMDFFTNNLTTEFHRADNWSDALMMHTKMQTDEEYTSFLAAMSMQEAQCEAFNSDWLFDVVEVPSV